MWIGMTSGKLGIDFLKTVERTVYSTAIAAVMKSSYRTETFACRSIASAYQLTVTFGTPN